MKNKPVHFPNTRRRALQLACAAVAGCALATGTVFAQDAFPAKPVHVFVPFAPGNTLDQALRQVAEQFQANTGQPMVIENKPGGAGIIAAQLVQKAKPDGYTLLLSTTSMMSVNPYTFQKPLPYDPIKSFKHVTGFVGSTLVLAANTSVPANNLKEFADWAKKQKDPVTYASFTAGNTSHFAGTILNEKFGTDVLHVPFTGTPPAVQNLLGGQVHTAFLPLIAVKAQVDAGKIKVLGVSSPERSPLLPNVPTFAEQGAPEMTIRIWSGFSAPAGTPDAVVASLNEAINKVLRSEKIKKAWHDIDFDPMAMTPAEYTQYIVDENTRWKRVVQVSGFKMGG